MRTSLNFRNDNNDVSALQPGGPEVKCRLRNDILKTRNSLLVL